MARPLIKVITGCQRVSHTLVAVYASDNEPTRILRHRVSSAHTAILQGVFLFRHELELLLWKVNSVHRQMMKVDLYADIESKAKG